MQTLTFLGETNQSHISEKGDSIFRVRILCMLLMRTTKRRKVAYMISLDYEQALLFLRVLIACDCL